MLVSSGVNRGFESRSGRTLKKWYFLLLH